jgi:hypothetical protein
MADVKRTAQSALWALSRACRVYGDGIGAVPIFGVHYGTCRADAAEGSCRWSGCVASLSGLRRERFEV